MAEMRPTNIMLKAGTVKLCREWGVGMNLSASEVVRLAVERLLSISPPVSPLTQYSTDPIAEATAAEGAESTGRSFEP